MGNIFEKMDPELAKGMSGETRGLLEFMDHTPTQEQCEKYREAHTKMHRNRFFYELTIDRGEGYKPRVHEFSLRDGFPNSPNILEMIVKSLVKGDFRSLTQITIKQYAQGGGSDVPCCLRNCKYEGDWPPCMMAEGNTQD